MPAVLNLGVFSIPPEVMPFTMDFHAFVKSFFVLASLVALVWFILSQLNVLRYFLRFVLLRMDGMVQRIAQTGQASTEKSARDQHMVEAVASTSSEQVYWRLRLNSIFRPGNWRTQREERGSVELQGMEMA